MSFSRSILRPAVIAVLFSVTACSGAASLGGGGGSVYGAGDPKLAAPNLAGGPIDPFLADGQAVMRALDAIAERSGKPLRVTSLMADGTNGLTVDVQEPKNHIDVDQYVVAPDGTLKGPAPVRLVSLNGGPITVAEVNASAFDPKTIGLAHLTQTVRAAIAASKTPDARVSEWEFGGPNGRRFMYFEAARARPAAELDENFRIKHISF